MAERRRVIVHADLDAFFAAAEILRRPELRGKPVIVGGQPGGRGVVAAASYEARAFGVRSAMPSTRAARLCPGAVFLSPDFRYYSQLSGRFRAILDDFSPLVEMVSVDEAYIDLTGAERALGLPADAARAIKTRVRDELSLVVSLGVATSRMVAKIASDLDKPDGLRVVEPGAEALFLAPLPVTRMPGIGPKAAEQLARSGVTTLGGLSRLPLAVLEPIFGKRAAEVLARARGIDPRPVDPSGGPTRSIGHERTFPADLIDAEEVERSIYRLAERTGRDLRRRGLRAGVIAVKLRYDDFQTVGRQRRLAQPSDAHQEIRALASRLIGELLERRRAPIRLLGVRAMALTPAATQLALFDTEAPRRQRLNAAIDRLSARYGPEPVAPGWRWAGPDGPGRPRAGGAAATRG